MFEVLDPLLEARGVAHLDGDPRGRREGDGPEEARGEDVATTITPQVRARLLGVFLP
jgi:hypothetical protein